MNNVCVDEKTEVEDDDCDCSDIENAECVNDNNEIVTSENNLETAVAELGCVGGTNINCINGVCSVACSSGNNNNNVNVRNSDSGTCVCKQGFSAQLDKNGNLLQCNKEILKPAIEAVIAEEDLQFEDDFPQSEDPDECERQVKKGRLRMNSSGDKRVEVFWMSWDTTGLLQIVSTE